MAAHVMKTRPKRLKHLPPNTNMDPPLQYPDYAITTFNTALNAGLLNPMSPPLPDRTRSSPTLLDMMAGEPDFHPASADAPDVDARISTPPAPVPDRQAMLQERVEELGVGSLFNDGKTSDVKLGLVSKDGLSVTLSLHRHLLQAHSRFFRTKLGHRKQRDVEEEESASVPTQIVEISDCEDIDGYTMTLYLMYCKDIRRRLTKEDVPKVLAVLKASAELGFDAGVLSCLEYLEAAPWAEEEEEKVAAVLAQLDLDCPGTADVLNRVSIRRPEADQIGGEGERTLTELLHVVLEGKDDKARRQMKGLFLRMLRHTAALKPAALLSASDLCLRRLHSLLLADAGGAAEVGREADNLHWVLEMLVDGQAGEEFLRRWAGAAELAEAHARAPAARRHGVSRVTARLFVGVGRGEILVSSAGRCELVRTWLGPFYEDYSWLRRGCGGGGVERREVEEGLGRLVLTLPMGWQQEVLLGWFDRFLDAGEDCPNLQRAFEVWWRRAFWRRRSEEPPAVGGTAAGQVRVLAATQGS